MRIAIASDHVGTQMKAVLSAHLTEKGHSVKDFGTDSTASVDYPVFGYLAARAVVDGVCDIGILICGTGIGMSLAANKVKGIRAAVCSEPYSAKLTRLHNDANVLCLGARVIAPEYAKMIVDAYLGANFMGERHADRVEMIAAIERGEAP